MSGWSALKKKKKCPKPLFTGQANKQLIWLSFKLITVVGWLKLNIADTGAAALMNSVDLMLVVIHLSICL